MPLLQNSSRRHLAIHTTVHAYASNLMYRIPYLSVPNALIIIHILLLLFASIFINTFHHNSTTISTSRNHITPHPKIGIFFQSSPVTRNRLKALERFWKQWPVYLPHFELYEVTGEPVDPNYFELYQKTDRVFHILDQSQCTSRRNMSACRYDQSIFYFVRNLTHLDWFMFSDDDTLIRPDNLYNYVYELETFLNPRVNIVLKGHANPEVKNLLYIHGGGGWLMSRAMCEFMVYRNETIMKYYNISRYYQPDTAISIIIRAMFKRCDWDEYAFSGDFDRRHLVRFDSSTPECKHNVSFPLNKIITIHSRGINENLTDAFLSSVQAPDTLGFYRYPLLQVSYPCRQTGQYPILPLRMRTPLLTADNFSTPLYKPGELIDENQIVDSFQIPTNYYKSDQQYCFSPEYPEPRRSAVIA